MLMNDVLILVLEKCSGRLKILSRFKISIKQNKNNNKDIDLIDLENSNKHSQIGLKY